MSLKKLQTKIGTTPDGRFGPKTMLAAAAYFKINMVQAAHFFAQCNHESAGFKKFSENLNYSESALNKVFGKYFPGDLAKEYARKPEKIASRVYGGRMGNGDEASGEGWKYRGRGAIQLTGKRNYHKFNEVVPIDVINEPEAVEIEYAFDSAKWFFDENNLWKICTDLEEDTIKALTRRINGGYNGLKHRAELTMKYAKYI